MNNPSSESSAEAAAADSPPLPPRNSSSSNSNRDEETASVDSCLPRGEFVSREHVEQLMREQDAELLESIHSAGGVTMLQASPSATRSLHRLDDAEAELSPMPRKKRSSRLTLNDSNAAEATGLLLESTTTTTVGHDIETVRRALSGEIWIQKDLEDDEYQDLLETNSFSAINGVEDQIFPDDALNPIQRTTSMDRRLCEAAQFAEAVGDLPQSEQDELRIIEEEADDDDTDDDDDDATEIHMKPCGTSAQSLASSSKGGKDISVEVVRKTRPQWPFGGPGTKRVFLDKLPAQGGASQDYVYKGIKSNPPEIIKRGISRGNYAQLHRKAWLEVSDKYHRYGKNLRLYYRYWERQGCPTNMFFDWLDSKGEAAGQPLPELEECPRSVLDADTVLYIANPDVSNAYAIKFIPDDMGRGKAVDVDGDPVTTGPDGWIFVLRDNVMYGAEKITSVSGRSKQRFHHSSFFGGKAVAAAGIFITDDEGTLTRLYPHSGHYRPGEADLQRVLFYMHHEGVDLRTFEMDLQQILHVARDTDTPPKETSDGGEKVEKKKKVESLQLVPAVTAACFLAHKARFIGEGIYSQLQKIRAADVTSVTEALALID